MTKAFGGKGAYRCKLTIPPLPARYRSARKLVWSAIEGEAGLRVARQESLQREQLHGGIVVKGTAWAHDWTVSIRW